MLMLLKKRGELFNLSYREILFILIGVIILIALIAVMLSRVIKLVHL